MSLNIELSDLFQSLASLMELKGENVFKVIAFQKVSRILRETNLDLKRCIDEGKLCDIEGIGKGSQQIIEEYAETGKSSVFEDIAKTVPASLVPLMQIEGLGPKTINLLWQQKNVVGLPELEKAIESGELKTIKGMGEKKIAAIKKGIEDLKARRGWWRSDARGDCRCAAAGVALAGRDPRHACGECAEIAGSLRRRRETIGDVDFIAAVADMSKGETVANAFCKLPGVVQTLVCGPSKSSVKVANGMQVDLRIVPATNFGAALLYFTGSKEHNVRIRGLAQKKKMTLNEWGLYKINEYEKAEKEVANPPKLKPVASETEEAIYKKLGLAYIEPELREDKGEVELAAKNSLPVLITRADIRGDLHTHTTASDGTASIQEMAEAAKAAGYEFLAITDHSKAMAMARGLTPDRLVKHIEEIHRIGSKLKGITLLAGSEVDILVDGRMDYDDDLLKLLDIVIASPHISLKQDEKKSTDRLLRAIDNRYVNIIGHPTGRLINSRAGLPLQMDKIISRAAENGTVLEINASFPRLDLNDINARHAIEAGCLLSIDTDAHSPDFEEVELGIGVARRAGATEAHVINCLPIEKLRALLKKKR